MSSRTSPLMHGRATVKPYGPKRGMGRQVFSILLAALVALGVAFASGCSGGGGGATPAQSAGDGELTIALTDAEGDFAAYSVDVTGLRLQRSNGDVVEALPLATRVNFAELVDLSELLTTATVPSGSYRSVVVSLDFTHAEIVIQNGADLIPVDRVVDAEGNDVGALNVTLLFGEGDAIAILPGIPAHLTLDFDLDASNEIVSTDPEAVVMVEPTLIASPAFDGAREHRVRGLLAGVDASGSTVTLTVRPFRERSGAFGRFTFATDGDTRYDIDEESFVGGDGLTALASHVGENFPLVAYAMVVDGRLLAQRVLAGSGLPSFDGDWVEGVVAARSGDTLSVRGAIVQPATGTARFRTTAQVLLGDATDVHSRFVDTGILSKDSISVGQRVTVTGVLAGDVLDATAGKAFMHLNQLTGSVVQADPLAVDLIWLNGLRPDGFDFAGTGIASAVPGTNDADPHNYEIDTTGLSLATIEAGDLVRVRGLVNDFGMAPPDFDALTVVDVALSDRAASLRVVWPDATDAPFVNLAADSLDLDLADARVLLHLAGVPLSLSNPVDAITLVPVADVPGRFALRTRGSMEIDLFHSFADWVEALSAHIDAGDRFARLDASGSYTSDGQVLTVRRAAFVLLPAATAE